MTALILASASPARLRVLQGAGIEPTVITSRVDEPAVVVAEGLTGGLQTAQGLATAKAREVAERHGSAADTLLLGCDSVLELDGIVFGKPGTPEAARELWSRMAGREAALYSGHHLIDLESGAERSAVSTTLIRTVVPDPEELEAYIVTGEPLDVAGGLTIDGFGGPFVSGVTGDHHGVLGLSLPLLRDLVRDLGTFWPDLWTPAQG